jgi:hypothetical protein
LRGGLSVCLPTIELYNKSARRSTLKSTRSLGLSFLLSLRVFIRRYRYTVVSALMLDLLVSAFAMSPPQQQQRHSFVRHPYAGGPISSVSMPVIFAPSTPSRRARLLRWLDRGGKGWCRVELRTPRPDDFEVVWSGVNSSTGAPGPVLIIGKHTRRPKFVLHYPYGNLAKQFRDLAASFAAGSKQPYTGIAHAYKVANAAFHLDAIKCLADGCHPCLTNATHATILEDDVVYQERTGPLMPYASPGTDASRVPQLLHLAMTQAVSQQANKLQLGVGAAGAAGSNAGQRGGVFSPPMCDRTQHVKGDAAIVGDGKRRATLRRCARFDDSHAYVLTQQYAKRIISAHASLLMHNGRNHKTCVNPWQHETCGEDPAVLRDFFQQCQARGELRDGSTTDPRKVWGPSTPMGSNPCRGMLLGSEAGALWTLREDDRDGFKPDLGSKLGKDRYASLEPLFEYLSRRARISSLRTSTTEAHSRVHSVTQIH